MCTNHTGIGSLPEAMYTKNDIRCRTHGMVRQASARQTIGLGWGHVESAMLDLLKNKPYLHSNAPRPAIENRRDTDRRRLRWRRQRSCTVINRWWIQRWGRWSSTINGRRLLWWWVERRLRTRRPTLDTIRMWWLRTTTPPEQHNHTTSRD